MEKPQDKDVLPQPDTEPLTASQLGANLTAALERLKLTGEMVDQLGYDQDEKDRQDRSQTLFALRVEKALAKLRASGKTMEQLAHEEEIEQGLRKPSE